MSLECTCKSVSATLSDALHFKPIPRCEAHNTAGYSGRKPSDPAPLNSPTLEATLRAKLGATNEQEND